MRQIKIHLKAFLVYIEISLLFFVLSKGVYAREACYCDDGSEPGGLAIVCYVCTGGSVSDCHLSLSGCPGGGCFTADTKIATPSGEMEIQDVKEGDIVSSFDPETGEIKEATVTATHKRQVQGYYILKTESGREIKVTGEHPILAVKQEKVGKVVQVEKVGKEIISFFNGIWEKVKGVVK